MLLVSIIAVFGLGLVLELGMQLTSFGWKLRNALAVACLVCVAFASGALVVYSPNVFSIAIVVVSAYRIFNYLRIVEKRMHEQYLRHNTRRGSLALLLLQALLATGWLAWHTWPPNGQRVWALAGLVQLLAGLVILASTSNSLTRTRWPKKLAHVSDDQLPTISLAIPARNETEDLQACLESIIPGNYPKLEILVLDDCSQLRRTPEIIRSYAHDGVRFIQGTEPKDTWLPKNQAYERLAQEASGEYILFCGVDTRFGPESIRQLYGLMYSGKKQMVSVLPWRPGSEHTKTALAQAMRYVWELMPPRRLFNRPPVLSTVWIIQKKALMASGGFAAVARSITPEAFFARKLTAQDGYSFVRADEQSGIESLKAPSDQRDTAIRTRYPQLHRRPENVLVLTAVSLFLVILPIVMVFGGYFLHVGLAAQLLAILSLLLTTIAYELITTATRTGGRLFGLIGQPAAVLYDVWMLHYSMWQYEFSTVEWKGRNICIPTMHVYPHLPEV